MKVILPPGDYWFGDVTYVMDDDVLATCSAVAKTFYPYPGSYPSLATRYIYPAAGATLGLVPVHLINRCIASKIGTFHKFKDSVTFINNNGCFIVQSGDLKFVVDTQWALLCPKAKDCENVGIKYITDYLASRI